MTTRATEEELLAAYHSTSLWRAGISFRRALGDALLRAELELGAALARNPPPKPFDPKALAARNDD